MHPTAAQTRRQFITHTLGLAATTGVATACHRFRRGHSVQVDPGAIETFRARLKGQLILPADAGYEQVRRVFYWNARTERQPALVARCIHDDDVRRAVEFARTHGLEIAVRAGGHSHLGWGTSNGLVIDLAGMKQVTIDPAKRIAHLGAGVLSGEAVRTAAVQGLAPVFGECPAVGAAGIVLGGGLGWLSGLHGAASDSLLSARMITAAGGVLPADAVNNPDLFWALRGGSGNFGVMTSFDCRLYPVGVVTAGDIHYPIREARTVLRCFRDVMAEAPDSFQAALNLAPDDRGVFISLCHAGDGVEAERLLRIFRRVATPVKDTVKRQEFAEFAGIKPVPIKLRCVQGLCLQQLSDRAIDTTVGRLDEAPVGALIGIDHYMHGEVCRVGAGETAFPLRESGTVHIRIALAWDSPDASASLMEWADETWHMLRPPSGERIYANYQTHEGKGTAQAVFGGNYSRLVAIKNKYDPDNTFRRNSNIEPRATGVPGAAAAAAARTAGWSATRT
jgi:FAD/FMN-containing dehydrogenase